MTRKIKSGALALVLGLTVCFGALAQMPVPAAETASPDDPMLQLQKLNQFYRYLNGTYVDTVHNDALVEKAIREMLLQLDPHSTYLTAEEMKGVKEVFDGSFSGIGIEFNVLSDTVIVVNVIAGGPSEKVGLLPNDRIVKADGKNIVGTKQLDVPKILRGPRHSRRPGGRTARGEGSAGIFDHPRQHSDQHDRRRLQSRSLDRLYPGQSLCEQHLQGVPRSLPKTRPARCADPRPAQQRRRPARPGDRPEQLLPARREPDRFDRRSARAARRGESHDRRSVYHGKSDRADERDIGIGQRNRGRRIARLGPGIGSRTPHFRQRARTAPVPAGGRFRDPADCRTLPYAYGPSHSTAL